MKIEVYSEKDKEDWDTFVKNSKNGTFLFYRDFMEYHSDRFIDFSMLFYKNDILIALLPGNISNKVYYSHQGLTYGGLITNSTTTTVEVLEAFEYLTLTLRQQGIKEIIYKAIPHIYHTIPSEEDLYALYVNKATIIGRNASSTILLDKRVDYSKSRARGLGKAKNAELIVRESNDYSHFWEILSANLSNKYNTQPVHSLDEIELLKRRFPENIILYGVYSKTNELVAGEVVFDTRTVTHAQYTATTNFGRENGAVDLVIDYIIEQSSKNRTYFDYGISTENNGLYLNEGLVYQKEGFGARAIVYDIYSIKLY